SAPATRGSGSPSPPRERRPHDIHSMKAKRRAVTAVPRSPDRNAPPTRRTTRRPPAGGLAPAGPLVREPGRTVSPTRLALESIDLSVDLGRGLVLPNPILVASGTFGYGVEYGDVVEV